MRSFTSAVRMAIWTCGEPVSDSWVLYFAMMFCFCFLLSIESIIHDDLSLRGSFRDREDRRVVYEEECTGFFGFCQVVSFKNPPVLADGTTSNDRE